VTIGSGLFVVSYVALWGLVLLLGFLSVGLARNVVMIHRRLGSRGGLLGSAEGAPVGAQILDLVEADRDGGAVDELLSAVAGQETLLGFIRRDCASCKELLDQIAERPEATDGMNLILVSADGLVWDDGSAVGSIKPRVIVDPGELISGHFAVPGVPFFFAMDKSGFVLKKGIANTLQELEVLSNIQVPLLRHDQEAKHVHA
jgi:hypothetical protein